VSLVDTSIHQTITELERYLHIMGLLDKDGNITDRAYWLRLATRRDNQVVWDVKRYWRLYRNDQGVHRYVHREFLKELLALDSGEERLVFDRQKYPQVIYENKRLHPTIIWAGEESELPLRSAALVKSDTDGTKPDHWCPLWKLTYKPVFENVGALKDFLRSQGLYNRYADCASSQAHEKGFVRVGEKRGEELWNTRLLLSFMGFTGKRHPHQLQRKLGQSLTHNMAG
jgi:hypothetical protein